MFIKKYIFDKTIVLASFKYFLAYLSLYLTKIKDAKNIKNIENCYIKNVFISNILIRVMFK